MKKLLSLGIAAVLVALGTSRPADAWCNMKFSVGLNWSLQSGNNNLLWGAWRNGQIPDDYGQGGYGPPGGAPGGQPFPWFGSNNAISNMPQAAAPIPAPSGYAATNNYGGNPYYAASYQPNLQASYQTPYYAPGYLPNAMPNYAPGYYGSDPFTWYYQR
jgi:hypothetical protein